MKPVFRFAFYPTLCCCLLATSLPLLAMSPVPEDEPIKPVKTVTANSDTVGSKLISEYLNRDPEADARAAIGKGDFRLLGFASRVTNLPGVSVADWQMAQDNCGVRFMKGFSDVIRSDEEATAWQLAYDYANRYNLVVLEVCLKKN